MLDLDDAALDASLEGFHLAFRALVAEPDRLLAMRGLGRAHHRILYLVRRRPGITVGDLVAALGVTKQAVNGPLRQLVEQRLIGARTAADDARRRLLNLTAAGHRFEAQLTGDQHRRLRSAFGRAGGAKVRAWHEVMRVIAAAPVRGAQRVR